MDWEHLVTFIGGTLVAGITAFATLRRTGNDRAQGVSDGKREERRDTISDRDGLIAHFKELLESERKERREESREFESRIAHLELQNDIMIEWNRALVDQIYRGDGPPPRERPTRT